MIKEIVIISLLSTTLTTSLGAGDQEFRSKGALPHGPIPFEDTVEISFEETRHESSEVTIEESKEADPVVNEEDSGKLVKDSSIIISAFKEQLKEKAGHEFYEEFDLGSGCYVFTTNDVMNPDYERIMLVRVEDNEAKCLFSSKENNTLGQTSDKIDLIKMNVVIGNENPNVVIIRSNDTYKRFEGYQFNDIDEGITKIGEGQINLESNEYQGTPKYDYLLAE